MAGNRIRFYVTVPVRQSPNRNLNARTPAHFLPKWPPADLLRSVPQCLLRLLLLSQVLLVGLAMAQVPVQSSVQSPIQAPADERLSINMRDADIGAVIQWIGEKTHKQIVIDPRVKGNVTVLANEPMSIDQAYQVFLAMLDVYGYAAVENGGVLRIFPAALAKSAPSEILDNYQAISGGEQIVYVFQARHVSANSLKQLLQPLIAGNGYLESFLDNNSLVLADDAANVKRLLTLMQQIDASGDFNIKVLKLKHAAADKVAGLATSLLGNQGDDKFAVVSDMRSNSVLMSGDPTTRAKVEQLVLQLDQPISAVGTTRVVYLKYLDAKEVLPILKGVSGAAKDAEKNSDSAAATISIESSESTNAIVMTAPPSMLDLMENVIRDIDIRRSQVLVEAIIVEVSKDFSESIGVEWNTNLAADNNVEAVTSFGLRPTTTDVAAIDTASSVLGSGLSLGFYRNGSLRALMQAIARESNANILSTPSILTLDNQEAEILVGSNVPFITGQTTSGASSTADPFTTIERQDIGLTLKITPKINQGDSVTLDVLQEIETIADSSQVANDIVTNKRSIKTKVLVEDETILVLGGLISDEQQLFENKVPFFGDLPLIGRLFKSTTESLVKKNLMVFIHPVIVTSEDDSRRETRRKYEGMKSLRERYQSGTLEMDNQTMEEFDTYRPRTVTNDETKQQVSHPVPNTPAKQTPDRD